MYPMFSHDVPAECRSPHRDSFFFVIFLQDPLSRLPLDIIYWRNRVYAIKTTEKTRSGSTKSWKIKFVRYSRAGKNTRGNACKGAYYRIEDEKKSSWTGQTPWQTIFNRSGQCIAFLAIQFVIRSDVPIEHLNNRVAWLPARRRILRNSTSRS